MADAGGGWADGERDTPATGRGRSKGRLSAGETRSTARWERARGDKRRRRGLSLSLTRAGKMSLDRDGPRDLADEIVLRTAAAAAATTAAMTFDGTPSCGSTT